MSINLDQLNKLCGQNPIKKLKFLQQFLELVPPVIEQIGIGLKSEDRQKVRKWVHYLAPQLTFFGIPEFSILLKKLDAEPPIPLKELKNSIESSLKKIRKALVEAESLANQLQENIRS